MINYKFTSIELAKIFGLYFNNPVVINGALNHFVSVDGKGVCGQYWSDDIKLVLTPIHKITDEHVIEIANLAWVGRKIDWTISRRNKNGVWMSGKSLSNDWQSYYFHIDEYCEITCQYFIKDAEEGNKSFIHNIGHCVDSILRGIPYILILDRLREMEYVVPYKAVDLFKGGVAIEKEEVK